MTLSVRSQLFLTSAAILTASIVAGGLFLQSELRDWFVDRIANETLHQVHLVREVLRADPSPWQGQAEAKAFSDHISQTIGARVTLVSHSGVVLGDSAVPEDAISAMDNHLKRPEIVACTEDDSGTARRFSSTLQKDMLYAAVSYQKGSVRGYVRVGVTSDGIEAASENLQSLLFVATLLTLGIGLMMSGYLTLRFDRSFRQFVNQSHALAKRSVVTESEPSTAGEMPSDSFSHEQASELLQTSILQVATERDRIEAVLQGMNEGVIGLDAQMRVTLVNRGARELLNLPEHTVGMAIQRLVPLTDFQRLITHAQNELSTETEIQLTSPGSRLLLVRTTRQRSTEGLVIVLYDITRIRHLEQMRRDFVAKRLSRAKNACQRGTA